MQNFKHRANIYEIFSNIANFQILRNFRNSSSIEICFEDFCRYLHHLTNGFLYFVSLCILKCIFNFIYIYLQFDFNYYKIGCVNFANSFFPSIYISGNEINSFLTFMKAIFKKKKEKKTLLLM